MDDKEIIKKCKKLLDDLFDFLIAKLDETYQEDLDFFEDRYKEIKNQEKEK